MIDRHSDDLFNDPYVQSKLYSLFFKQVSLATGFLSDLYQIKREAELSYYFDLSVIQDGFRFRALHRARAIAGILIDEKGEFSTESLNRLVSELKDSGYVLYPEGFNDGIITEHLFRFLTRLTKENFLIKMIKRFQKPLCHKWAERLVLDSLGLYQESEMTNSQIRQAILCACMTPLRQSVGSCFASAPAILIQREQVESFIEDLYQLLTKGTLSRTFGGTQYSVPLSPNVGIGDLRKHLFLTDSKAMIAFSPGLIAAFESLEIIPSHIPFTEKARLLNDQIPKDNHKITAEELIHQCLLDQMKISDDDLFQAQRMEAMHQKTVRYAPMGPDSGISKKIDKLTTFTRKEKQAKAAFMGVCDNALLKAWEFTLASFCDVKMEFSRWNLYHSLGLSADEWGGIGELIFKQIDEKLQKMNAKIEEFQKEYQAAFDATKATEVLLRQAGSESEARRLQAEYQSRAYHMQSCLELRNQFYSEGSHFSTLFNFFLNQYALLFPEYFQEIYDPQMVEPESDTHADSLAGFRLVYKQGRSDPSLWTLINNEIEFIDCLIDFFSSTESRITAELTWEEGRKEILNITTMLISHIQSEAFLLSAKQRLSKADPLRNHQKKEKKPWGYISGGDVNTLLKTYFCKEKDYSEEEKWVENESELLSFIVDTLKNLKPLSTNKFLTDPWKGMLATSPTHAFILLPGQQKLCEGWQESGFTYTWVRDQIFLPNQKFYSDMHLSLTQQIFLLDEFCLELPPLLCHSLHKAVHIDNSSISIMTWRNKLLEAFSLFGNDRLTYQKKAFTNGLDAFLYQVLPIVPGSDWKSIVKHLLSDIFDEKCREALYPLSETPCAYMTARRIKELAKTCYMQSRLSVFFPFDLHNYIAQHARFVGLAAPSSMIVADTNWANQYFGFVVNPGTGRLEFWSLDRTASQGVPISAAKQWINGTKQLPWTLYVNPEEYSSGFLPLMPYNKEMPLHHKKI